MKYLIYYKINFQKKKKVFLFLPFELKKTLKFIENFL
jgi:hypothetical protein